MITMTFRLSLLRCLGQERLFLLWWIIMLLSGCAHCHPALDPSQSNLDGHPILQRLQMSILAGETGIECGCRF